VQNGKADDFLAFEANDYVVVRKFTVGRVAWLLEVD